MVFCRIFRLSILRSDPVHGLGSPRSKALSVHPDFARIRFEGAIACMKRVGLKYEEGNVPDPRTTIVVL